MANSHYKSPHLTLVFAVYHDLTTDMSYYDLDGVIGPEKDVEWFKREWNEIGLELLPEEYQDLHEREPADENHTIVIGGHLEASSWGPSYEGEYDYECYFVEDD